MKWSKSFLFTLKEVPADAEIPSHILMVRGGYIRKVAPGIFTYGPLALRAIRKFEAIVREELTKRGCQEILMPMVQPKELWDETNRWTEMGAGLQKMKNRNGHDFCLGATHEEVTTDFVRQQVKSYRDLPVNLFQIQTKFRDEIRPRFGLLRGREFIMKDAYSFDRSKEDAQKSYLLMREAYTAIFSRLGVDFRMVKADTGNIGGDQSEEFHVLAESGEDLLLVSDKGTFAANVEVCPAEDATPPVASKAEQKPMEEFATPGLKTIDDLSKATKVPQHELVKTMFFSVSDDPKNPKPIAVLLRGNDEVNPIKLKNFFRMANAPLLLTDEEVKQVTGGASPGSCGPVGLKIKVFMDKGVEHLTNYMVGANKDDFHLRNVNHGRDYTPAKVVDFRMAKAGDRAPDGGILRTIRGIEVGHIFYLGTKYSKAMKANFLNAEGKLEPIEMGCFGIGISRTVQAVIEQSHDQDGVIWPKSIAPFQVHVCLLDPQDPKVAGVSDEIVKGLEGQGVECFIDDREERPGVKFKDADLLGMPLRLNIGGKGVAAGEIEIVTRKSKGVKKAKISDCVKTVLEALAE